MSGGIFPIQIDEAMLEDDEVVLTLLQSPPPSQAQLLSGASRPHVVQLCREIFADPAAGPVAQINHLAKPSIILLPELAIGLTDWSALDELVRQSAVKLTVIAGFGFSKGAEIDEWLKSPSSTDRKAGWGADFKLVPNLIYNGGFCWIHSPGKGTTCICFIKRSAEQQSEAVIEGQAYGKYFVSLRFKDLSIFPVICSDLIEKNDAGFRYQAEIRKYVEAECADGKPILIAGMLLQRKISPVWQAGIQSASRNIDQGRVTVALANSAFDLHCYDEKDDQWRNYSGVYVPAERAHTKVSRSGVRLIFESNLAGHILRDTSPAVVGGVLRWKLNSSHQHVWSLSADFASLPDGSIAESTCRHVLRHEARRFLRRLRTAEAPATKPNLLLTSALDKVEEYVHSVPEACAGHLISTILYPERPTRDDKKLADGLFEYRDDIRFGARALGAIAATEKTEWETQTSTVGQLKGTDPAMAILVWSYPGYATDMKVQLQKWERDGRFSVPTAVFAKAKEGALVMTDGEDRRYDIAAPPDSLTPSATEPRSRRMGKLYQLGLIDEVFHEAESPEELRAKATTLLEIVTDELMK